MTGIKLTFRVGAINLRVQVGDSEFSTELFNRYQRSEQALVLALMVVVNGVFTRKVARITEELCALSSQPQLDPIVGSGRTIAWLDKPSPSSW